MKNLNLPAIILFVLISGGLMSAFGQGDRGTIRGTVADATGAVVPGARVVLTGTEIGGTRETTTSDEGIYVFPGVLPVVYQISVEAQGFQKSTVENFKVAVQVTHTLDIKLQVGEITNEVTVDAVAESLQADTPVRQTNVTEEQVKELPLSVSAETGGRSPLAFIFLDSNVSASETSGETNALRFPSRFARLAFRSPRLLPRF